MYSLPKGMPHDLKTPKFAKNITSSLNNSWVAIPTPNPSYTKTQSQPSRCSSCCPDSRSSKSSAYHTSQLWTKKWSGAEWVWAVFCSSPSQHSQTLDPPAKPTCITPVTNPPCGSTVKTPDMSTKLRPPSSAAGNLNHPPQHSVGGGWDILHPTHVRSP
jgi:hypothetical protein